MTKTEQRPPVRRPYEAPTLEKRDVLESVVAGLSGNGSTLAL
jgi:hypothetical protein